MLLLRYDAYVPYAIVTVRHAATAVAALALTAATLTWTAGYRGCRPAGSPGTVRGAWSGPASAWSPLACMMCVVVLLLDGGASALGIVAWAVAAGIGTAYAPLSVTTLDRAAARGRPGNLGSAVGDVLGQALGTGVAGAIVAAAAAGTGHGPAVALAFSFGIAVALIAVIVGARLPGQLTGCVSAR